MIAFWIGLTEWGVGSLASKTGAILFGFGLWFGSMDGCRLGGGLVRQWWLLLKVG